MPDRGNTDYSRGREAVCGGPTAVSTLAGFINALQMACRFVQYGVWTTVLSHQATQVLYCVYMGIRSNCIMMMITLNRGIFPNQANEPQCSAAALICEPTRGVLVWTGLRLDSQRLGEYSIGR